MKIFSTTVVIVCDGAAGNFQRASAVRSVLETFCLRVYFYQLLQQQNVLSFLAGDYPDCDYVIWFCYGCPDSDGNEQLNFSVVHQKDNDYGNKSGWERVNISLTPFNLDKYIKNPQGILISGASSGNWAKAFLAAGYKACILPTQADVACNSHTLFITGFFYYLTMHGLDYYTGKTFTPQESVIKAAAMDQDYKCGTQLFQYYE